MKSKKMSPPKYASIQTTSHCNASCVICPYRETKDKQPQGDMEWNLYKKIIDELSQYKLERILLYLMNEPLMDKGIVRKINYAKEKNPNTIVHIVSNGSLLTNELSKQIIQSKIDYIEFSVLANTKESYQKIMGLDFESTRNKILEFIRLSKEYGKPNDYVNIKITRTPGLLSDEERDSLIKFWKSTGIKNVFYYGQPISRAGNVTAMRKIRHKTIHGCKSIWTNEMIHILFDGTVVLCCMDWRREVILGNVRTDTIYDIWNGEKYNKVRKMVNGKIESPPDFICKRCEEAIE